MIFTTKNKELAIFGKTLSETREKLIAFFEAFERGGVKGQDGIIDTFFSKDKKSPLTPELLAVFEKFKEEFNSTSLSIEALQEKFGEVDKRIIDYAKTCKNGEMTTKGFKASIDTMSFSAKAGKVALQALATVGNMFAMWAISKGFELAARGIDELVHSAEHCKERVDELMSSYESALSEANNNAKTVEDLASRYEELSKGVNNLGETYGLTAEETKEYQDICNKIADMFPQLIQGYTDEGTAILSLKGNVEQLRDAYKEAQQEAYNLIINGKNADGNDIIKNWENLHDTGFWADFFDFGADDVGGGISMQDAVDQLKAISEMSAETYRNIENAIGAGTSEQIAALTDIEKHIGYGSYIYKALGIDSTVTDEEFEEARKKAKTLAQTYQAELDSALKDVRTLANAYLMTNDDYALLDEQAKNAASIVVNSMNAETANSFDSKESVGNYVTEIVDLIKEDSRVHDALIELFKLDTTDIPVEQAKMLIDTYIESIAEKLGKTTTELKVQLGFENFDETYSRLQNSIRQITDDHGIADREQTAELTEYTKDFTASQVELWLEATHGAENATQAIKMYEDALADAKETLASTPLSISETVTQIDTRLKSAFSSLQSAYQEIFTLDEDTGEKLFASLDEVDITDKFKPILDALQDLNEIDGINVDYSSYEDFVSVLSDTSSTAEEVQEQFDRLATDIIYTSDCTNMSAETFNLLAESLSEMGITNAYEMLGKIRDAQEELAELSYDAEAAIVEEGKSIQELGLASIETEEYLRQYLLQKNLAQNPLSTSEDLLQLESMCNALGVTGEMLETVTRLKLAFEARENGVHSGDLDDSIKAYQERLKELAAGYGTFSFDFNAANKKSSSSGSSSSTKDTTETFDWIEQAIENVEKEIKELDEIANSSYSTFSEKNEAFAQEIRKVSDEIDLQQQAYAEYMHRAESIGLSEQYKQLVQSGAINIEDIADENLQNMISEYQKWYDKAQDVSEAIKDLKTDMKDLYVSVYELQTGNLKDRLDSDSITQKQYLDGLKEAYEQFYADLEDFAEQYHEAVLEYLAEEKDYLNSVAGAASSLLDTEIDKIQDDAQLQEDSIQRQIDLLEAKKKPLQDELDALEDKAKRENLILNLQKAQYELARSENQRTKLVNDMPDAIVI